MRRALVVLILLSAPLFAGETCTTDVRTCGGSGGAGSVTGPAAACSDNQIARWDGATTSVIQCSTPTISDAGAIAGLTGVSTTSVTVSGLTASQLVVTDGSKNLASNGAITTNAIPKSASSGATLTASQITDTGSVINIPGKITSSGATVTNGTNFDVLQWTYSYPASTTSTTTPADFAATGPATTCTGQLKGIEFDLVTGGVTCSGTGAMSIFANNTIQYTSGDFAQAAAIGINGRASGAGTGMHQGGFFSSQGAAGSGTGVEGRCTAATNCYGVVGLSDSGTNRTGVYASLTTSALPTAISSALIADNGSVAAPIAVFRDNSATLPTTAAAATYAILDGGLPQYGLGVLTAATMAAETQSINTTVTSSYTWTNAQVAALPTTAGDITVATLPAKTQLLDALVIITGVAVGPATVTVSCGDANGGTPFINLVAVADAKAAANTVYGDAAGERGTSIDTEFYYLPSYTATTLVTCHFISTVANLSTVTGSTGRVILTTRLLP